MRVLKQANLHDPENDIWGDCHRTCIAMLLNLERDEVPNFAEVAKDDADKFHALVRDWLAGRGYATFSLAFDADLDSVLSTMRGMNPGTFYLLGGMSRTGCAHSVIGLNDRIIADPSRTDSGIVGPIDGYYWITVLVPMILRASSTTVESDPLYCGQAEEQ